MLNKNILVTGANGFIGKALVQFLCNMGYAVRATVRSECALNQLVTLRDKQNYKNLTLYNLGDLSAVTDWKEALKEVDTVVHCAARAHILNETSNNPLESFRQTNCIATQCLATEASRLGVKRFIFLSSIGVLGNSSEITPFNEYSQPNPKVPYAQAKWEAEQTLLQLCKTMELVIIRPPLVYGTDVKGNFEKLLRLINKGIPLPFGKIKNKRQFIGIDNLIDFISTCIESPEAANQVFLIADKEQISTTELIQILSKHMQKKTLLIPIQQKILQYALDLMGKKRLKDQLLGNMEICLLKAKKVLNWEPAFSMNEQLEKTIKHYIENQTMKRDSLF